MERASARDSHGLERLRDGQEVSATACAGRGTCSHGGHRQESRSPDSPEAVAVQVLGQRHLQRDLWEQVRIVCSANR